MPALRCCRDPRFLFMKQFVTPTIGEYRSSGWPLVICRPSHRYFLVPESLNRDGYFLIDRPKDQPSFELLAYRRRILRCEHR